MKKKVYSNVGKLKCISCGNYHYQWWMISHQKKQSKKIGCASFAIQSKTHNHYEILCDYGSGYDTSTFKIVDRLFPKKTHSIYRIMKSVNYGFNTPVCDKCIERFIRKKYVFLTKSWFM